MKKPGDSTPSTHSMEENKLAGGRHAANLLLTPQAKLDGSNEIEQCFGAAATCALHSQQQFFLAASELQPFTVL